MGRTAGKITFEPKPLKVGSEWHILATYPSGQQENIAGFHSEAEATEWLGGYACQTWLKARGYAE